MKIGSVGTKRPIPGFEQHELPFTSAREHYFIVNHFNALDPKTKKYYWHSSQITWRVNDR